MGRKIHVANNGNPEKGHPQQIPDITITIRCIMYYNYPSDGNKVNFKKIRNLWV